MCVCVCVGGGGVQVQSYDDFRLFSFESLFFKETRSATMNIFRFFFFIFFLNQL